MHTSRWKLQAASALAAAALSACTGTIVVPSGALGAGGSSAAGGGGGGTAGGGGGQTCEGPRFAAVPMQRLTRAQFEATVKDVLGIDGPGIFPLSLGGYPYSTYSDATVVAETQAQAMLDEAEQIAMQAADQVPACTDSDEAACARAWLTPIAQRLLRDASPAKVDTFVAVFTTARAGTPAVSYPEAAALALEAMLLDPELVYLVESSGDSASWELDGPERARRLAYVYTGQEPDPSLSQLASGGLDTPDALTAQAQRLAGTPAGRAQLKHFLREWLGVEGFADTTHAPEVAQSLATELDWLLDRALDAPDGLHELLASNKGWVNSTLETFYGLPSQSTGPTDFHAVDFPDEQRVGVLTHPLVLARYSHGTATSPILRGKFIRTQILCGVLGTPPAGAQAQDANLDPNGTTRERSAARLATQPCGSCHQQLDPVGLGFEGFDGAGRYLGATVDVTGTVVGGADAAGDFNGPRQLGDRLAGSQIAAECFTRQWLRFELGRPDGSACAVADLKQAFDASGHQLPALFTAAAGHPSFFTRAEAP